MSDLIDKLNLLLRSNMNNFLSESPSRPARVPPPTPEELEAELAAPSASDARPARVPVERLGKDIDKEISVLRKHIDQALNDEDKMRDRLDQMQAQIENLDRKADEALQQGDQDKARDYVRQLERQKQISQQLQTDLKRHGAATSELIEQVNTLDAIVSDARRQQVEQTTARTADSVGQAPAANAGSGVLSHLLKDARERVEGAINSAPAEPPKQESAPSEGAVKVPIKVVN